MKNHLYLYLIFLILFISLLAGCHTGMPQLQEEKTGVPRVVLIELFNTRGCPASKVVNEIMEEIAAEYENTEVILVEEAGWGKYSTQETHERFKWYFFEKSKLHTPSVCFNGLNQSYSQGFSLGGNDNSGGSSSSSEDSGTGETAETGEPGSSESDPALPDTPESTLPDPEDPNYIYPQTWATGDGTKSNPWANNCILKAYNACPVGGTIYLKAGYYQLKDYVFIKKAVSIIGEGRGKTIVKTADNHGFSISEADHFVMRNMTIDASAQTKGAYIVCVKVNQSEYVTLENLEVMNSGWNGLDVFTCNHATVKDVHAHHNYRHGVHSGTASGTNVNRYNTYQNLSLWNNGNCGLSEIGNEANKTAKLYNTFDHIHAWDNANNGIWIGSQAETTVTNCVAEGNHTAGINLVCNTNALIYNCKVNNNKQYGLCLQKGNNYRVTETIVKNNSTEDSSYPGILIKDSKGTILTSCQSYDDQEIKTQKYGLWIAGTVDWVQLTDCTLSPNLTAAIYNPAGAMISGETKLARLY